MVAALYGGSIAVIGIQYEFVDLSALIQKKKQ